jgi:hypothetical protein
VSTELPGSRCRILPFTPKPQPVATSSIDARYLYSLQEKRRQELARVQRRVPPFPRPEDPLQTPPWSLRAFDGSSKKNDSPAQPAELAWPLGRSLAWVRRHQVPAGRMERQTP